MLVAKKDTHEKMQDGTYRKVKAGEAFLNPETSLIKNIEKWATKIEDVAKEAVKVIESVIDVSPEVKQIEIIGEAIEDAIKKRGRPKKTEVSV